MDMKFPYLVVPRDTPFEPFALNGEWPYSQKKKKKNCINWLQAFHFPQIILCSSSLSKCPSDVNADKPLKRLIPLQAILLPVLASTVGTVTLLLFRHRRRK